MILRDMKKLAPDPFVQYRLGIMGGTFDPVHLGHLYCAEQAMDACGLDAVVFMPAGRPSFKSHLSQAPIADRLRMCELAVSSNPKFYVSDMESDEERMTYTIDTMRRLRHELPENIEVEFIVGSDALSSLHLWKEAEELASLCGFICVSRPSDMESFAQVGSCAGSLDSGIATDGLCGFKVKTVGVPMLDISSSEVRRRASLGISIRYIVPDAVREYILNNSLYSSLASAPYKEVGFER